MYTFIKVRTVPCTKWLAVSEYLVEVTSLCEQNLCCTECLDSPRSSLGVVFSCGDLPICEVNFPNLWFLYAFLFHMKEVIRIWWGCGFRSMTRR